MQRYRGYRQGSLLGRINKQHFKQIKDLKKQFVEDEIRLLSQEEALEMESRFEELTSTFGFAENMRGTESGESKKSTRDRIFTIHPATYAIPIYLVSRLMDIPELTIGNNRYTAIGMQSNTMYSAAFI